MGRGRSALLAACVAALLSAFMVATADAQTARQAVRARWVGFAEQAAYGSARTACSMLSKPERAFVRSRFGGRTCEAAIRRSRVLGQGCPSAPGIMFTRGVIRANVQGAARHYLRLRRTRPGRVTAVLDGTDPQFMDSGTPEVWVHTRHGWTLVWGDPPIFTPQC